MFAYLQGLTILDPCRHWRRRPLLMIPTSSCQLLPTFFHGLQRMPHHMGPTDFLLFISPCLLHLTILAPSLLHLTFLRPSILILWSLFWCSRFQRFSLHKFPKRYVRTKLLQ